MRGKKAKQLRKAVYGDNSPRPDARTYGKSKETDTIYTDDKRHVYQKAKKLWNARHPIFMEQYTTPA